MSITRLPMPALRYFEPAEFGDWWPLMDPALLRKLDQFRDHWRAPVRISPAPGALGRRLGKGNRSLHNVDEWGGVKAADVLPQGLSRAPGDLRRAYSIARLAGFTGIGVYPDWHPQAGLHLDMRPLKRGEDVATWAGVARDGEQVYVAIEEVIG